jgi:hypothetical protein
VSEGISGANHEVFRRQVLSGRTEHMLEQLPLVTYLTMAPFLGAAPALELIEEKLRAREQAPPAPRAQA